MNFLHGNMLFFAAAGVIPIIIHLIFRQRYKRIKWAAMKFLLAAYKKNQKSLLIENLLLLLIRILIVVLLALMFSRPTADESILSKPLTRLPDHYIFALDDSYSMGIRDGNSSPFDRAKKHIREIVQKAKSGDTITIITFSEKPRIIDAFREITQADKSIFLQQMEEILPSELGSNVIESTTALFSLIKNPEYNKHKAKKIFIISDLQRKPWVQACKNHDFLQTMEKMGDETKLTILDVGTTSNPMNLTISSIETDGIVGTKGLTRFIATIHNYSNKNAENIPVNFFVETPEEDTKTNSNHKQATEYISVPANDQQKITFFYNFLRTGSHSITIDLSGDNLEIDNKRHLIVKAVNNVKILVIDGDQRQGAFESETDNLMAAIGKSPGSLLDARVIGIGELTSDFKFESYDVVILANLQTFDDERRFDELQEFVKKGGGLLIWMGDKVDYKYYNDLMFRDGVGLLPGKLVANAIGKASEKEDKTTFKLDYVNENHKALQYLANNKDLLEDFRKYLTYKFFPVQLDPEDKNVSILASLDHPSNFYPKRYPAIIERIYGQGKVLLYTTTADREWNNLHSDQFGYIFLILVHEFIQYVVSPKIDENNLAIGATIKKSYPYYVGEEATMTSPDKIPIKKGVYPSDQGGPPYQMKYTDTLKSGIYRLDLSIPPQVIEEQGELDKTDFFAININALEGDIERISQEELLSLLDGIKVSFQTNLNEKNSIISHISDSDYWKPLLLLILLLSFLETFMAMWFGRYEK